MNRRLKKKKYKQFQKQFCEPPFYGKRGYAGWQCNKCGWNSLAADQDHNMGYLLDTTERYFDFGYDYEIEYICPVCGNVFSYIDGVKIYY